MVVFQFVGRRNSLGITRLGELGKILFLLEYSSARCTKISLVIWNGIGWEVYSGIAAGGRGIALINERGLKVHLR